MFLDWVMKRALITLSHFNGEIQELANPDVFGWVFYLENTETYLKEKNT
jgi:hypothetical protein